MRSSGRKFFKRVFVVCVIILAIPVLLVAVCGLVLRSGAAGELVRPYLSEIPLDGEIAYSDISGSALRIPRLTVCVDSLRIIYPHEKYDSLYSSHSEISMEGRGEVMDTLASAASVEVGLNLFQLMRGKICLSSADVRGLRVFVHQYDTLTANWNIFSSESEEDTTKKFVMPDIKISHLRMGDEDTRVVFCSGPAKLELGLDISEISLDRKVRMMDLNMNMLATANCKDVKGITAPVVMDGIVGLKTGRNGVSILVRELHADMLDIPMEASGMFRMADSRMNIDAEVNLPNCPLGRICSKYGPIFTSEARRIKSDAILTLDITSKGVLDKTEGLYPQTDVAVSIPHSNITYKGVVENGSFDMTASASLSPQRVLSANVDDICINGAGVNLTASAKASDILGEGLQFSADMDSKIRLGSLMNLLLGDNGYKVQADGMFAMTFDAKDITRAQLTEAGFLDADFKLHIAGDTLKLNVPGNDLSGQLLAPDISIHTMKSLVEEGSNALAIRAKVDSMNMVTRGQFIRGKNLLLLAQDASKNITNYKVIPPLSAVVKADMFAMRGADSALVAMFGMDNRLVIKPLDENGELVPDVNMESGFSRFLYITPREKASMKDINMTVAARQVLHRESKLRKGRNGKMYVDSLRVPEYVRDAGFLDEKIYFTLSDALQKSMDEWNPSGHMTVGGGVYITPIFPLKNSFRDVDMAFSVDRVKLAHVAGFTGSTDMTLSATATGLRKLMTGHGRGYMQAKVEASSHNINLNEILDALHSAQTEKIKIVSVDSLESTEDFISAMTDTTVTAPQGKKPEGSVPLLMVPGYIGADVQLNADNLHFSDINFTGVHLGVLMKDRTVQLSDIRALSDIGNAKMDAFYSTKSKSDINLGYDIHLSDVRAEKVISLMPEPLETIPALQGSLDVNMAATCKVDTNMNVILPSMNGLAKVTGRNLMLDNYGSLERVARLLMFKDTKSAHIDDMTIQAIMSDNKLEVFPFLLGIDRYKLALTGLQDFSRDFTYHVSVLKSPLPFVFGLKVYGESFDAVKVRLEKPQYRTTVLPAFDDQMDEMQINLVTTIKDIYNRSVDVAVKEMARSKDAIHSHREEYTYDENSDTQLLSASEMKQYDLEMIKMEAEEETEMLSAEIDEILAGL